MLKTIHVSVTLNGKDAKRPLRVYDSKHGVFGVVVKGECLPVVATGPKSVKLHTRLPAKPVDACRAAKLADLGIVRDTRPTSADIAERKPVATQAASIATKLTPELATQMIAMLQAYLAD